MWNWDKIELVYVLWHQGQLSDFIFPAILFF